MKKVEAETTIKLRQLELQQGSIPVVAPLFQPVTAFDVSKNSRLVPVFCDTEVNTY